MGQLDDLDMSQIDDSIFDGLPRVNDAPAQPVATGSAQLGDVDVSQIDDAIFDGLPRSAAPVLEHAATRNPDTVADAHRIAQSKGMDIDLVEQNYAYMSAREKAERQQRLMEAMDTGATMAFMADPTNAGMAHDDLVNLMKIEQDSNVFRGAAKTAGRAVPKLFQFGNQAAAYFSGAFDSAAKGMEQLTGFKRGGVFEQGQNYFLAQSEYIEKEVLNSDLLAIPEHLQQPLWDNPQLLANPEYLVTQVGEAASSMLPMVAAYVATGGTLAVPAAVGGLQEAAGLYEQLIGDGVDQASAGTAATSFGVVVGMLDKLGLSELTKKIPTDSIMRNLARRAASGAAEGATEYLEEPFQAAFGALAKGKNMDAVVSDVVASLKNVDVIVGSFLLGSSGAISKTVDRVGSRVDAAQAGTENAARLSTLSEATAESKLAERSSEAFGEFVESVLPDEAKEQFVDAQQLVTLFQEALDEGQEVASPEEVVSKLEVLPEAFREAFELPVSVPKIMQNLTKHERDLLIPHMKADPLAMSEAESVKVDWQAVAEEELERYEAATERDVALASEQARVVAGLVEQGVQEKDAAEMSVVPLAFARAWESYGLDGLGFMQRLQVGDVSAETQAGLWQDERGSLSFLPESKYLIKLAANADNSTFLHECAHVFLAEMSRVTGQAQVFERETTSPALEAMMEEEEQLGEKMNAAAEDNANARDPEGVLYADKVQGWDTMEIGLRVSAIEADYFASLKDLERRYNKEKALLRTEIKAKPVANLPPQLQKDMKTLRGWLNLQEGRAIAKDQHEQFARGFEAYLREGNAPSSDLVQVFHKFRNWLVSIYKDIKGLNVEINDEVRDVFDRMLATDEQIAEARYLNEIVAIERNRLEELEADPHVVAQLKKWMSETEREATAAMDRATLRDRNKRMNAAKKEARAIVDNEPVYQQIMSITKGSGLDEAHMLEYYGKDTVADIRKKHRGLIKKNGQMADDIASELGYDEADQMVYAFVDAPRRTERIANLAEELFGETESQVNPDEIVLANEALGTYLEKYSAMLSKNIRSKTYSPRDYNRRIVKEQSGATVIREATRYDVHQQTMRKNSRLREEAAKKGDGNAEAFYLDKMRFALEFIGESVRVREETQKIVSRAKRYAKNKSGLDFHYRDHIRALVQRFGMGGKSLLPVTPAHMSSLKALIESEGDISEVPPSFPEWLVEGTEQIEWKDLTVDQFRVVNDLIQYLNHQGRETRKENKAVSKERIDNAAEACAGNAVNQKRKIHTHGTVMRKVMDAKDKVVASLDTLQYLISSFDADNDTGKDGVRGVNLTTLFDPLVEAQNDKSRVWGEMQQKVRPALLHLRKTARKWERQHGKSFSRIKLSAELRNGVHRELGDQIKEGANTSLDTQEYLDLDVPAIMQQNKRKWTPDTILGLMLHTGTKSNLERVFAGYPELKEGQTLAYLKSMLTHKDWDAIKQVWDAIDSLYPQLDAVHKKMNGFHMTKIEAQPFGIERGGVVKKYKGGYFPARYDNTLPQTHFVKQYTEMDELLSRSEAINQTPAARSGFTQGRKNKAPGFPLRLSVNVAVEHMYETIHYMTHAEALRFADRLTKHQKWEKAYKDTMGEAAYDAVRGHLKAIARPEQPDRGIWQCVAENLRSAATPFILGWNFGVATKQVFSLPGGVHDIGMKEFCKGLKTVMSTSPRKHMKWIHEVSPYMRDRANSMDRELSDLAHKFRMDVRTVEAFGKEFSHQDAVDLGFWPIRMADMATTYVLWVASYEKAMQQDKSPEQAVFYADDIIRKSQPSSQAIDQTMWQRHKGALRMLSMFQTYTVRTFGARQRHHYRAMKAGKMSKVEYAKYVLYDQIFPPIAMSLAFALMWGDAPDLDDDEAMLDFLLDMGINAVGYQFAGIPLVSSILSPFDAMQTPAATGATLVQRALRSGWDFFENPDEKHTDKMLWSLFHLGSYATRIPASQVARRFSKGMKQLESGDGTVVNPLIPSNSQSR